jgi:hypothetical protein
MAVRVRAVLVNEQDERHTITRPWAEPCLDGSGHMWRFRWKIKNYNAAAHTISFGEGADSSSESGNPLLVFNQTEGGDPVSQGHVTSQLDVSDNPQGLV